jgi:hypothetical protein
MIYWASVRDFGTSIWLTDCFIKVQQVYLIMVRQRPPNWEKEVERFIIREQKNSFYLSKIFDALKWELEYGFSTERNRLELRRLAAISIAKHEIGVKNPNKKLIEKAANAIDKDIQKK